MLTFRIWLVGFVVATVATLPPWPCFRRDPVKWLASAEEEPPVEAVAAPPAAAAGGGGGGGGGGTKKRR